MAEHIPLPDFGDPLAPGMFALSEPGRIRAVLRGAGWQEVTVAAWHTSIVVGGGTVDDAVAFLRMRSISRRILDTADAAAQARALQSVREAFERRGDANGVHLDAAVWLVTARNS